MYSEAFAVVTTLRGSVCQSCGVDMNSDALTKLRRIMKQSVTCSSVNMRTGVSDEIGRDRMEQIGVCRGNSVSKTPSTRSLRKTC